MHSSRIVDRFGPSLALGVKHAPHQRDVTVGGEALFGITQLVVGLVEPPELDERVDQTGGPNGITSLVLQDQREARHALGWFGKPYVAGVLRKPVKRAVKNLLDVRRRRMRALVVADQQDHALPIALRVSQPAGPLQRSWRIGKASAGSIYGGLGVRFAAPLKQEVDELFLMFEIGGEARC